MLKRISRAISKIALSPVVICFALVLVASEMSSQDRLRAAAQQELIGHTVRATLPGGDTVDNRFVSASRLEWRVISGPNQGEQGSDVITIERIAPQQFFVNRVQTSTGDTVSEVYDTQIKRVWIYRTRLDPQNALKRRQDTQSARVELIDG